MTTTTTRQTRDERLKDFIDSLIMLFKQKDRAALAALRRGLGKPPGETMEMHPYVVPFTQWLKRTQEDACYLIAALFGLYPGESWTSSQSRLSTNLGASLRQFVNDSSNESSKSIERRFVALLNAHADDLSEHLRQTISLLKSKDIRVDWQQLLHDVINWDDRFVQRNWSKAFWGAGMQESSNDITATTEASTTTQDQN